MAGMKDDNGQDPNTIPLVDRTDVIVCGGGPAGVSAAIAAARAGARTTLIESKGFLGGVWTGGLLSYVLDAGNKAGLIAEYQSALEDLGGKQRGSDVDPVATIAELPWVRGSYIHDPEIVKLMLDRKVAAENIRVRLYSNVVGGDVTDAQIDRVITESKSGREAWEASVYIDATGDGDLAARTGCRFDIGHPETGQLQPMSLLGLIGGVRFDDIVSAVGLHRDTDGKAPEQVLLELMQKGGHDSSYGKPALHRIRDDLFALMANHLYGYSGIDADDLTEATVKGRSELFAGVAALRSLGGVWKDIRVVATAAQVGVREARRIRGLYTVCAEDLVSGRRFDDGICSVTFPVDVHALDGSKDKTYGDEGVRSEPYEVPLRSLISCDRDNLLMAGRCISGDFYAHASYRVTGNAVILGQAAGAAAAACVRYRCAPKDLTFSRFAEASKASQRTRQQRS